MLISIIITEVTKLAINDVLPLSCTRIGTCCHGNNVFVNPWELHALADEKNMCPRKFRDQHTEFGGIRLKFQGKKDHHGKQSCNQYIENFGCCVHLGRPLACRLFPIGRQIQNNEVNYIYQGEVFPCLKGCSEVINLPHLSVEEYLKGQETILFEQAQDAYLEVMQNLADVAFTLFLDTGLAESGETKTLSTWKSMGQLATEKLAFTIGTEWLDYLLCPKFRTIDKIQLPLLNFIMNYYNP